MKPIIHPRVKAYIWRRNKENERLLALPKKERMRQLQAKKNDQSEEEHIPF